MRLELDADGIVDATSFHEEAVRQLGFPEHYGRSWDAWLDTVSDLLPREEPLVIVVNGGLALRLGSAQRTPSA